AGGDGPRAPALQLGGHAELPVIGEPAQTGNGTQLVGIDHRAQVDRVAYIRLRVSAFRIDEAWISRLGDTKEVLGRADRVGVDVAAVHLELVRHALGHVHDQPVVRRGARVLVGANGG